MAINMQIAAGRSELLASPVLNTHSSLKSCTCTETLSHENACYAKILSRSNQIGFINRCYVSSVIAKLSHAFHKSRNMKDSLIRGRTNREWVHGDAGPYIARGALCD